MPFSRGLVARLAMTRYQTLSHKYPGVSIGPCGLLLLSTPNAGSKITEWPDVVVASAGAIAGVRQNLVHELQVLNDRYADGVDNWTTLKDRPLVRCLCESSTTYSVQVRYLIVVELLAC